MSPVGRPQILEGCLEVLREGGTVSLDSAARAAGLTKPGLMYHFRTKEALMVGLLDHLVDGYERELRARLPVPAGEATPAQRIGAYLDWCFDGDFDSSRLVAVSDPRLREQLCRRFAERMGPWLDVPDSLPAAARGRLHAVRLIADGTWYGDTTDILPIVGRARTQVRRVARELLKEASV